MTITLKKNYEYDRDQLIRAFINLQYKRNDQGFLEEHLELEEKFRNISVAFRR